MKRHFSFQGDMLAARFFNRKEELQALDALLTPSSFAEPGKMVVIAGPKDSGKSALIREFRRRQQAWEYKGVSSYVDLRQGNNGDPQQFGENFCGSLNVSLKWKAPKLLGDLDVEAALKPTSNGLTNAMNILESYCLKRQNLIKPEGHTGNLADNYISTFPTIFIDEANALSLWTRLKPEGEHALGMFFRFLVRISKQECGANVVLASSENFFMEWILGSDAFRGHNVQVFNVGHLSEEDAKAFLLGRVAESHKQEVAVIWDDIFTHVGGAVMHLFQVASVANTSNSASSFQVAWQRVKESLRVQARWPILQAFHPERFSSGSVRSNPKWSRDQWVSVIKRIAETPNGIVSYASLCDISGLDSMIEHDLLHFRSYSQHEKEIVDEYVWPIVMPVSKMAFLVMKDINQNKNYPK